MMYMGQLGHESADLIAYMSAAGVRPILPGENPANWCGCRGEGAGGRGGLCAASAGPCAWLERAGRGRYRRRRALRAWAAPSCHNTPAPAGPGENRMLDVAGGSAAGERKGPDFVELYKVGGEEGRGGVARVCVCSRWLWCGDGGSAGATQGAPRSAPANRHPRPPPPMPARPRAAQTSELLAVNAKAIAAASEPAGEPPSASGGTYAASLSVQLRELLSRQFTRLWRLPGYSALRLIVAVLFALVLGSLYWDKGQVGQPGQHALVQVCTGRGSYTAALRCRLTARMPRRTRAAPLCAACRSSQAPPVSI